MESSGKDTTQSTPKKSAPDPWKIPPQEEWTDEMWEIAEAVQEMAREQNGMPLDLLKEIHDSMEQGMKAQGQPVEPTSPAGQPPQTLKAKTSSPNSSELLKGERLDMSGLLPALLRRRARLK
jgi:hypothetical protein